MQTMSSTDLRVASYNIRKARGLDNKRMPERTLEVINGLKADIVVLQEADKRLGARAPAIPRKLIEAETDLDLVEVAPNGLSLGWHGNAILLRSELRVAEIERVTLPGFEPRGALRVSLDIAGGLCVVATHLGLRRRDRQMQLEALLRATEKSRHAIVAGDFNEWSRSKGLDPLRRRFEVHTPGRSFHARRPLAALDRFAVTSDIEVCSGGVDDRGLARRASDHLPIWANIRMQPQSAIC